MTRPGPVWVIITEAAPRQVRGIFQRAGVATTTAPRAPAPSVLPLPAAAMWLRAATPPIDVPTTTTRSAWPRAAATAASTSSRSSSPSVHRPPDSP